MALLENTLEVDIMNGNKKTVCQQITWVGNRNGYDMLLSSIDQKTFKNLFKVI